VDEGLAALNVALQCSRSCWRATGRSGCASARAPGAAPPPHDAAKSVRHHALSPPAASTHHHSPSILLHHDHAAVAVLTWTACLLDGAASLWVHLSTHLLTHKHPNPNPAPRLPHPSSQPKLPAWAHLDDLEGSEHDALTHARQGARRVGVARWQLAAAALPEEPPACAEDPRKAGGESTLMSRARSADKAGCFRPGNIPHPAGLLC
jgi:hypothetical protein